MHVGFKKKIIKNLYQIPLKKISQNSLKSVCGVERFTCCQFSTRYLSFVEAKRHKVYLPARNVLNP